MRASNLRPRMHPDATHHELIFSGRSPLDFTASRTRVRLQHAHQREARCTSPQHSNTHIAHPCILGDSGIACPRPRQHMPLVHGTDRLCRGARTHIRPRSPLREGSSKVVPDVCRRRRSSAVAQHDDCGPLPAGPSVWRSVKRPRSLHSALGSPRNHLRPVIHASYRSVALRQGEMASSCKPSSVGHQDSWESQFLQSGIAEDNTTLQPPRRDPRRDDARLALHSFALGNHNAKCQIRQC